MRTSLVFVFLLAAVGWAQSGPALPTKWSADVEITGVLPEPTAFVGVFIVDHPGNRMYSQGQMVSGFAQPQNVTSVSECDVSTSWKVIDGRCDVDCCNGTSDAVASTATAWWNHFPGQDLKEPTDIYSGCACAVGKGPLTLSRLMHEAGNCSRDGRDGTLYKKDGLFGQPIQLSLCLDQNDTPIYYHQVAPMQNGYTFVLDVYFATFTAGVTNPSVFNMPANCDCSLP